MKPKFTLVLASALAFGACTDDPVSPEFRADDAPIPGITAMTRNVYVGTDVDAVIVALADGDPGNDQDALVDALTTSGQAGRLEVDAVMFATGRVPATSGLGLEAAGVALDAQGAVSVDEYSATNVPCIHAVGDVTNRLALTPVAIREGAALATTLFGGRRVAVDHRER